jgi:hypothetical protein
MLVIGEPRVSDIGMNRKPKTVYGRSTILSLEKAKSATVMVRVGNER